MRCDGNQLDALGVCGGSCAADADADGICDDVDDCVGAPRLRVCNGLGEIYECGCADISEGDCDCDGNQLDALGVCGGSCAADADADGICDDVDDCVGAPRLRGLQRARRSTSAAAPTSPKVIATVTATSSMPSVSVVGPARLTPMPMASATMSTIVSVPRTPAGSATGPERSTSGCAISEGDCDRDGNQLDALGVCGGSCAADADADGICDDVDDCVGTPTPAGSATGPERSTSAAAPTSSKVIATVTATSSMPSVSVVGPARLTPMPMASATMSTIVSVPRTLRVCNGPGEIYECGCADIPEGDCDCDGNQLDALGVCGGSCAVDADADGICDDVDDCVGAWTPAGSATGGEIYECGCADIPEGDCDRDGKQLDALGVCGGSCAADADADGICDDVDDCVGAWTPAGSATGPERSTSAAAPTSPKVIATVTATSSMPSVSVVGPARLTPMPMASATMSTIVSAPWTPAGLQRARRDLRVRLRRHPRR